MNPTSIQNTRGTTADHASFAGLPGEISIDTDKSTAVVHDGTTLGGFPLARQSVANVMEFGAVGDGVADDTAAINAAIQSLDRGVVVFPFGQTFRIEDTVALKSGVSLAGNRSEIICAATLAPIEMLLGTAVTDVEIAGLVINGEGAWTATPFANPSGGGNSVGFTSGHFGVLFTTGSSGVSVRDCVFTGLTRGATAVGTTQFSFIGNRLTNLGNSGLYSENSSYGVISDNIVRSVLGNMTPAGTTTVADSKYADGIYLHGSQSITVSGNVIENVKRIGVVLEADSGADPILNSRITISGNTITNCNGSRGSEFNAAIWSENGKSDYTCIAQGNTLDNTGAAAGAQQQWGIVGTYLTVTGNVIHGWQVGITGTELRVFGNTIEANHTGILVGNQSAGLTTVISGNRIALNRNAGVHLYHCHGNLTITSNLIEDNGQDPLAYNCVCGVLVEEYYNNQKVLIAHNTFISSAETSDTVGQLSAIIGVGGGQFSRTVSYISHNQFVFTAETTPTIGVTPTTFCYDNTSTLTVNELYPANELGNVSGKFAQTPAGPVRNGTASPSGVVTPQFLGEDYLDTVLNKWYKAVNYSDTGWVALN